MDQQVKPRRRAQVKATIERVVKENQKTLEILAAHDRGEPIKRQVPTAAE